MTGEPIDPGLVQAAAQAAADGAEPEHAFTGDGEGNLVHTWTDRNGDAWSETIAPGPDGSFNVFRTHAQGGVKFAVNAGDGRTALVGHTTGSYRLKPDPMMAFLALERAKGPEAEAAALNSLNRRGRKALVSMLRKGNRHAR